MEKLIYWGKYRHYKNKDYTVVWEATHTETDEELVIYKPLYKMEWYPEEHLWVRPKKMFLWYEDYKWERVKRFTYIWE